MALQGEKKKQIRVSDPVFKFLCNPNHSFSNAYFCIFLQIEMILIECSESGSGPAYPDKLNPDQVNRNPDPKRLDRQAG